MVEFFGIPYFEYVGGIGGIAVVIMLFWFLARRSRGDRISLEREEISEDRDLLGFDKRIREDEKEEKYHAKRLYNLFFSVQARTRAIGFKDVAKLQYLNFIINGLTAIILEEIDVKREEQLMQRINDAINVYLNGLPLQDAYIGAWVAEIRKMQSNLNLEIIEEGNLLHKKEELLRKELQEMQAELGSGV